MNDEVQEGQIVTEGVCDSCNQAGKLNEVSHHQEDNDHVWHYCDRCTHVHNVEVEVNKRLKELMATDAVAANDPVVVSKIWSEVDSELQASKATE